jgi:hypothetical protein
MNPSPAQQCLGQLHGILGPKSNAEEGMSLQIAVRAAAKILMCFLPTLLSFAFLEWKRSLEVPMQRGQTLPTSRKACTQEPS